MIAYVARGDRIWVSLIVFALWGRYEVQFTDSLFVGVESAKLKSQIRG